MSKPDYGRRREKHWAVNRERASHQRYMAALPRCAECGHVTVDRLRPDRVAPRPHAYHCSLHS